MRALTAFLLLSLLALPYGASDAPFPAWHGANLIVTRGKNYNAQFDALRELGANAVALVFLCQQHGTALDCAQAPARSELRALVQSARERGLRVMLKPHVETQEFSWRGEIRFQSEAEWRTWFENYARVMLRYARLDADAFCVGTELAGTSHRAHEWRTVIARVRARFHRALVYAAHFEEFENIAWWDALDAIGIDAYFPLEISAAPVSTVDELIAAWQPYRARLEELARTTGKPILFTEVGYQSRARAFESPWQRDPALRDDRAQSFAYQAVFETFADARWWRGALWWDWHADDPDAETGFTPTLKPAEGVLMAHWRNQK